MNVARAICQKDVVVKLSRHHVRQRSTVRRVDADQLGKFPHAPRRRAVPQDRN